MSLATLIFCDEARSGYSPALLIPPRVAAKTTDEQDYYAHPFMWNDGYARLEERALSKQNEAAAVAACQGFAMLAQHAPVSSWEEVVVPSLLAYHRVLMQCREAILAAPKEDLTHVCIQQIDQARALCVYNVGMVRLVRGATKHDAISGDAVRLLREAAGFFESALAIPMPGGSQFMELSPDNLRALALLATATTFELSVTYFAKDASLFLDELPPLCFATAQLYGTALTILRQTFAVPSKDALTNLATVKRGMYEGLALFMSSIATSTKGNSRRRRAMTCFEQALEALVAVMPGARKAVEDELQGYIASCADFAKLSRRGLIPAAAAAVRRARSSDLDAVFSAASLTPLRPTLFDDTQPLQVSASLPENVAAVSIVAAENEVREPPCLKLVGCVDDEAMTTRVTSTGSRDKSANESSTLVRATLTLGDLETPISWPKFRGTLRVCVVIIADFADPLSGVAIAVRDHIALAIKTSLLQPGDTVAIVERHPIEDTPVITAFPVRTLADLEVAADAIVAGKAGCGRAPQSSFVHLARAAQEWLTGRHLVDEAHDIIVASERAPAAAWSMLWAMKKETGRAWAFHNDVDAVSGTGLFARVHGCHIGSYAGAGALRRVSMETKGNFSLILQDRSTTEASVIEKFRVFIANTVTGLKLRLARAPRLTVQCANDVTLASLHATSSDARASSDGSLPTSGSLLLSDVAVTERNDIALVFRVPHELSKQDVVPLASVVLSYVDNSGVRRQAMKVLENRSVIALYDRESNRSLLVARVQQVQGTTLLRYPGRGVPIAARGGEALSVNDSIAVGRDVDAEERLLESTARFASLPDSSQTLRVASDRENAKPQKCVLHTPEGTIVELSGETVVTVTALQPHMASFAVEAGSAVMLTTASSWGTIVPAQGYSILVHPKTLLRLTVTGGQFHMKCVFGQCVLTTSLPGKTSEVRLLAPKQSFAVVGDLPTQALAIADDPAVCAPAFCHVITEKIAAVVAVDQARLRSVGATFIRSFVRLTERALRSGTLSTSKASRRCRLFLIDRLAGLAKLAVSSSLGAVVGDDAFHETKRLVDAMASVGHATNAERRTWQLLNSLRENADALVEMRPIGGVRAFVSKVQLDQVLALMSAKERAVAMQALAAEAKRKEAVDAEDRRRRVLAATSLAQWDFQGKNAYSLAAIMSVLRAMRGADRPEWTQFFAAWQNFIGVFPRAEYSLSADQLVSTLTHFAAYLNVAQFNDLASTISDAASETAQAAEVSRISRALFAVFQVLDTMSIGCVSWGHVTKTLRYVRDTNDTVKRLDRAGHALAADIAARRHIGDGSPAPVLSLEDVEAIPIPTVSCLVALSQFFEQDMPEAEAHSIIFRWHHYLSCVQRLPRDTPLVVARLRKEKELEPLVQWEMPHVFDGITDRNIREFGNPAWQPPAHMNELCAPLCIVAGWTAKSNVAGDEELVNRAREDYGTVVRNAVRSDARRLFEFLRTFPVLSMSRRVAQHASLWLEQPEYDTSNLLRYSPVLSSLCAWTRVALRMAFLVHEWEVLPHVAETMLRSAIAEHANLTPLLLCVASLPTDSSPPRVAPVKERAPQHNVHFRKVFDAPPVVGWGDSTPFEPKESPRAPPSLFSSSSKALPRPGSAAMSSRTPSRPTTGLAVTPSPPPPSSRPNSAALRRFATPLSGLEEDDRIMSCVRNADEHPLTYDSLRKQQRASQQRSI